MRVIKLFVIIHYKSHKKNRSQINDPVIIIHYIITNPKKLHSKIEEKIAIKDVEEKSHKQNITRKKNQAYSND